MTVAERVTSANEELELNNAWNMAINELVIRRPTRGCLLQIVGVEQFLSPRVIRGLTVQVEMLVTSGSEDDVAPVG